METSVRILSLALLLIAGRIDPCAGLSQDVLEPPPTRSGVRLVGGAYDGLVVAVDEGVPKEECRAVLEGLENAITDASQRLYSALGGRAWFRSVTILLPDSWTDAGAEEAMFGESGAAGGRGTEVCGRPEVTAAWARGESAATADIRVTAVPHPLFGENSWTRQSGGCGAPGDFIEVTHSKVAERHGDLGALLVRDWAKYRYGVFDEAGIGGDSVFPLCYRGQDPTTSKVTGCSDLPIGTAGPCEKLTEYGHFFGNVSHLLHANATSSIMFDPTAPQVTKFCNSTTHDRYAPTKHNLMCDRRSVMDVILQHQDFANNLEMEFNWEGGMPVETVPRFTYKREILTRYILVVEDTKHMLTRESWTFLRTAVRKFAFHDLPSEGSVEVGLVGATESGATRLQAISSLAGAGTRDALASCLPYNPGDSTSHLSPPTSSSACLHCGIKEALDMLEERSRAHGPAASVIVVVAAGMEDENSLPSSRSLWTQVARSNSIHVPIATINYPMIGFGRQPLDPLSAATGGLSFTITEKRLSIRTSHLSAYMALSGAFVAIRNEYQRGGKNALPIEIHFREIKDDDAERGRQLTAGGAVGSGAGISVISGSFVVEDTLVDTVSMGWPRHSSPVGSRFALFIHNTESPLVRKVELVSPSNHVYRTRSDALLNIRALTLQAALNESGTWTYTIEKFPGNPQPLYVQVTSTPRSKVAPVIKARAWTSTKIVRPGTAEPVVIYVEVTKGNWPVVSARVEVTVRMWPANDSYSSSSSIGTHSYRESEQRRFLLLDTGSGDPDVTKGDGIYSRYFVPPSYSGSSDLILYMLDITVTDDGNTAYTWQAVQSSLQTGSCCGSSLRPEALAPLPSFQRMLPPVTLGVMKGSSHGLGMTVPLIMDPPPSKVGDLRSEVLAAETRARLTWIAPGAHGDMGTVDSYEVRFSRNLATVADNFDAATPWEKGRPFPLAPGSDTSFTLDFVGETALLDTPLFFAIRAVSSKENSPIMFGRPSNVVRVLVPSPPPPPPPPPPPVLLHPGGHFINGTEVDPNDLVVIPQRAGLASGVGMALQVILPAAVGILLLIGVLGVYFFLVAQRRRRTAKKHQHKPSMTTPTTTYAPTSNGNGNRSGPMPTPPPAYEPRLMEDGIKSDNLVRWIGENDGSAKRFSLGDEVPPHVTTSPDPRGARLSVICSKDGMGGGPMSPVGEGGMPARTLSPYQSWTASQLLHEHERRHSPYGYAPGPMHSQQPNHNSSSGEEVWCIGPPQQFNGSQGQPSLNGSTHSHSVLGIPQNHGSRAPSNMGGVMMNGMDGDLEGGQWIPNHMNGDACHGMSKDHLGNPVEGSFLSLVDEGGSSGGSNGSTGPRKVPPPTAPKPTLHHGLSFNQASHQGSLTSVRSSALDKKKQRNVTQV
ncbi:calcium-activated chloride channel regulator 2-like [Ischnura elegans]|uniref:calcium-activated chloride channel regulator 2-like n=1 Tax=Ischnura elegans TaxID=197161 RepID=UPI001ED8BC01|nr:calcium-activated chloride channel regulator 2-like [Ischnura elegans]